MKKVKGALHIIGVDAAKDAIYGRLKINSPGPGYIHFPIGGHFTQNYFDQLASEKVLTKRKEGRPYRVWTLPPGRRNEALDTMVYALAARHSMRVRLDANFGVASPVQSPVKAPVQESEPAQAPVKAPVQEPEPAQAPVRHEPFVPRRPSWIGERSGGWFRRQ